MNKVVCFYALSGLFAGAIFSSCICGTPRNYKAENDYNLFDSIENSLSIMPQIILNGFLILAIKFLHYLFSRCYKSATPYTMIVPFWVAFTLTLVSYTVPRKEKENNRNTQVDMFYNNWTGLFAGAIFSSCICGTPRNCKAETDYNLFDSIENSLSTMPQTILNGFLILAIKFLHYLFSRCYKSATPYTMIVPFWVAFTLSVSYMSELSLT